MDKIYGLLMIPDLVKDWENNQEFLLLIEEYAFIDIQSTKMINEYIEKTRVERHNAIREQQIW